MKLNPIHERYLMKAGGNSIECLLELLDGLPSPILRDDAVFLTAMLILEPQTRQAESVHDTIGDLFEEHVSYKRFKERLRELAIVVPEELLVDGVMQQVLVAICKRAFCDCDKLIESHRRVINHAHRKLDNAQEEWEKEQILRVIQMSEEKIRSLPTEIIDSQVFYVTFCAQVLKGLLDESEERSRFATEQTRDMIEGLSTDPFPGAPTE